MMRFHSYTRRAKDALGRSSRAAHEYGHDHLGPEHLLLGVVEVKGRALGVLWDLGVDAKQVREEVERLGRFPPRRDRIREVIEKRRRSPDGEKRESTAWSVRYTAEASRVLKIAEEESAALGSDWIGTEHLLLGILRVDDPIAARALRDASVQLEDVRRLAAQGDRGGAYSREARGWTSSDFDEAFEVLLRGHRPVWHVVGRDRERLVTACVDWLTPEQLNSLDFSDPGSGRAMWILDRLLPLTEVELFRQFNSHTRWLHTLYPLFRRSPEDMASVTPERFAQGEHSAAAAAWVETRATDDDLLGWNAECLRRGWPNAAVHFNTLAIVEYCRRTPSLPRLVAYLDDAPAHEVPVILHCLMRLVAGSVPRTEKPEPGLETRLREAGFEALAEAVAARMKPEPDGPMVVEVGSERTADVYLWESGLARTLWIAQQTDADRLMDAGRVDATWRLADIVPHDRPEIWERLFKAGWHSDDSLICAFGHWCTPEHRHLLVPHFDHEDIEWAACALEAWLALAPTEEAARHAEDRGRPAWQIQLLNRWLHAPPELRPPRRSVRGPLEIVFDYRVFDPFEVEHLHR